MDSFIAHERIPVSPVYDCLCRVAQSADISDAIQDFAVYIMCFIAPLCLLPLINYLTVQSYWDFHNSTLGCMLGIRIPRV